MRMAKAMGINTIGTYAFWNLHEPEKGKFDFSGNNDIAEFIRIAQEEGLWVVLRPSPYVCAEWEYGGYPYWLQNEQGLVVRSTEPLYLKDYEQYITELGKQLSPLLVDHGGNILMVQVENEYGSYAGDTHYLEVNKEMFIRAGFNGLLYTCDPAKDIARGHLPGLLPAVNGLSDPLMIKSVVNAYHDGKGPYYIAEWYPAWFDWWGAPHHTVAASAYAGQLDTLLAGGISINMYMFHGGTTRGFMNGANDYDTAYFQPQVSSYDYDAPLDEAGNATDKFMAFRAVIEKHLPRGTVLPAVPATKPAITIPPVSLQSAADIYAVLPAPVRSDTPMTFEQLNQAYGFVLYRTTIPADRSGWLLLPGLKDFGVILLNGKRQGVLNRMLKQDSLFIPGSGKSRTLDILVENLGRVNFGPALLKNHKGITAPVTLDGVTLKGWAMYRLPMQDIASVPFSAAHAAPDVPLLRKGSFVLSKPGDTYLDMREWGKGCVWINGHNLGRFWQMGPQQTIYVPGEWLKTGKNEIVVLELIKTGQKEITTLEKPILNVRPT
jgi:beta-galactosidase